MRSRFKTQRDAIDRSYRQQADHIEHNTMEQAGSAFVSMRSQALFRSHVEQLLDQLAARDRVEEDMQECHKLLANALSQVRDAITESMCQRAREMRDYD